MLRTLCVEWESVRGVCLLVADQGTGRVIPNLNKMEDTGIIKKSKEEAENWEKGKKEYFLDGYGGMSA